MKGFRFMCRISALALLCNSAVFAQDAHLSQFDAAPLFYNPALAGTSPCEHRFIGNMKHQWGGVYRNYLLSYDRKLTSEDFNDKNIGGELGAGIMLNHNGGGAINQSTTELRLIPAYHKYMKGSALKLSVGANLDFSQSRVDEEAVVLPDGIEADLQSEGKFAFDIDLGANIGATIMQKYPVNFGVAVFHLMRTRSSFYGENKTGDKPRLSFNANTIIPVGTAFQVWPSAIYMNQKTYSDKAGGTNEMVGGSWVRYDISNQVKQLDALMIGVFSRFTERSTGVNNASRGINADSFIIGFAAEAPVATGVLNAGISYDVTISDYTAMANKGEAGSFELSVKYYFCKRDFYYTPPAKLNPVFN